MQKEEIANAIPHVIEVGCTGMFKDKQSDDEHNS
jgi:hypothetical protein